MRTATAGQFASSAVVLVGGDGRRVGQGHIGSLSSPLAVAGGRAGEWGPWRAGMAHGWGRSRETRESGSVTPAHRECNAHGCSRSLSALSSVKMQCSQYCVYERCTDRGTTQYMLLYCTVSIHTEQRSRRSTPLMAQISATANTLSLTVTQKRNGERRGEGVRGRVVRHLREGRAHTGTRLTYKPTAHANTPPHNTLVVVCTRAAGSGLTAVCSPRRPACLLSPTRRAPQVAPRAQRAASEGWG